MFITFLALLFFFSNDFGLIDIEKTAIITAVAIDKEGDEYSACVQVAVPQATNANNENAKTHITGKGATIGSAIKNVGDLSGWYPNLSFCNLLIVGSEMTNDNTITVLDYFTKTLKIQDSAIVVLADGKASEALKVSTPLDNISSFALQKILLKNPGHDKDTATVDIKTFCVGYYSITKSSYMPVVKILSQDGEASQSGGGSNKSSGGLSVLNGGSSGSSGSESGTDGKGKAVFDMRTTALFLDGVKVGELSPENTLSLNFLTRNLYGSNVEIKDVETTIGQKYNYLLTVLRNSPSITLSFDENGAKATINLDVYCKISDQNTPSSDSSFSENLPLPLAVKVQAERQITGAINELIQTSVQTKCDFLNLQLLLYKYHYPKFHEYKDDFLSKLSFDVKVSVSGQK